MTFVDPGKSPEPFAVRKLEVEQNQIEFFFFENGYPFGEGINGFDVESAVVGPSEHFNDQSGITVIILNQ
jgi:hypothetical protein